MELKKLTIHKYKSIQTTFTLDEPGRMHFLIGANNAGKTNILDALYQLYKPADERLHDKQAHMELRFTFGGKELKVHQENEIIKFTYDKKQIEKSSGEEMLDRHVVRLCATRPVAIQKLKKDFNTLRAEKESYKLFYDAIQKYIPKINLHNDFFKISHTEDGDTMPFARLGDGFQQVFVILMYLYHPQYTILLLEEPEIHLHPALVKRLLHIIETNKTGTQFFLTTHSPLFIRTTNLHRLFRVTKGDQGTRVFSPRLSGKRLNYNRLVQELNADNLEMFFADKVLLVEGASDHLLMRGLINTYYEGAKNIKVVQTYGKSNMDVYIELLDIFHIPYAVLLDRDALYDTGITLLQQDTKASVAEPEQLLINQLKKRDVYILPNGSIEKNYPRKYQRRRKHKTQNALYAASHITKKEFYSPLMKHVREVIEAL